MVRKKLLIAVLSVFFALSAVAQSNPSTWVELEFSKKIVRNLKVEFNPELRLFNDFKIDTYILEGGLSYKLHDYLTVAGYYRYENTNDYKPNREVYEWEPSNRFAFDAKTGFDVQRFNLSFRLRYTNGAEVNNPDEGRYSFFRYRTKIDYDIKGSKLIPTASIEAFHDLDANYFDKMRYTGGVAYPLNKNNELSLFYRLQDYLEDPEIDEILHEDKESMHIIGIGYSLKF